MNHNQKIGQLGERLAREFLLKHKYKIIEINIKTSYKEIDIIAYKNGELVFVEVKTRTSSIYGYADESVSSQKLKSLKNAIGIYLNNFNKTKHKDIRLDLVAIDLDIKKRMAKVKHYKNIA